MSIAGPSPKCNYNLTTKTWNYYVLASESSQSSDEGSETAYSVQGKETDLARDTSDLDSDDYSAFMEYEIATATNSESRQDVLQFVDSHESSSDDEVIKTTVIRAVIPEGDLLFADSEDSLTAPSIDSELSPFDYWNCAQCQNPNNNPMFRYCEKCYKVRKDFFPPPPKHRKKKNRKRAKKQKKAKENTNTIHASTSDHAEGIGLHLTSKYDKDINNQNSSQSNGSKKHECVMAESHERGVKRKRDYSSEEEDDKEVKKLRRSFLDDSIYLSSKPDIVTDLYDLKDSVDSFSQPTFPTFDNVALVQKSFSDPAMQFSKDDLDLPSDKSHSDISNLSMPKVDSLIVKVDKSVGSDSRDRSDMCIVCLIEPKSGVFVHGRIAHICCCYKCSVKVWFKTKRCPICKCKVSNVLRAFVS